jgi:hypothetical protein
MFRVFRLPGLYVIAFLFGVFVVAPAVGILTGY